MTIRRRVLWSFAVWLFPAAITADLTSCNDGSTGCCMICPECACGDSCVSCAVKCMMPKGCACGSTTELTQAALRAPPESLMSLPDAGARE
ncbi:MAG TPA: hypothetical protein VLA14_09250 [Polyangia bacterium]|nr:hypothetical protein [Polyangia bacterium]